MSKLMQRIESIVIAMLFLVAGAGVAHADVKIKTRNTTGGTATEQTTYIKGKRQRTEIMDGLMITIMQCDLQRDLQINPQTKAYTANPYAQDDDSAQPPPVNKRQTDPVSKGPVSRGGVVMTTITSRDTGERKQIFGYTARHIITTIVTESSPDACNKVKSRIVTDGWYIDAAFGGDCELNRRYANYPVNRINGCQDRYQTKQIGAARTGYPVWLKTTENGEESFTSLQEAIEISGATLDPALFDVPAGYREVKDLSEMYNSAAMTNAANTSSNMNGADSGLGANVKNMAQPTSDGPSTPSEKRSGVVRLGFAAVKTGSVGEGLNATELAAAMRNTMAEYLKSPSVELVQLESRLPSQIELESKQKECDFAIYVNVSHKKGGGGFGSTFSKVAPVAGSVVPYAGYGSTGGYVAGQVASAAIHTAAGMSANVKAKDELSLEVKLQQPGNANPALIKQFKAKAKSNGEDIISPLIEQAAQAILDAASKQ